ncbi:unnamed protein product [Pipistrellus nathusii]|uniref:Sialophorin n=1 Tax=Pipistrellus nathusii TaxID=59473 RepID=A0ABP0A990_PIPNA
MESTLLLLFLGGVWAQTVNTGAPEVLTLTQPPFSSASTISEASNLNSVASDDAITRVPEAHGRTGPQISLPSSAPGEVPSPETSVAASVSLMANAVITQEAPTRKLSMSQEISDATSDPAVPAMTTLGLDTTAGETMATSSLETSTGTRGLPVTMATSSLETSSGMLTSESPVTMTTSSLETSNGTSGPPVTVATSSLGTSNGTSGPPVTMATSSLGTPQTSGPPVTMTTSSLGTPQTSGPPITMTTSSLGTPQTSGSPISRVKIFMSTPAVSTNRGGGPAQSSDQKTTRTLTMMAVLVALLAVIVLLALVLLWRRRQKRRTGALTLNRGGKHNGVVDAWAGPARVSDEEAVVTAAAGVSGGDKGAGLPEGAGSGSGSGRRPTLTTFFGRRKSRQGSLALEELKAEPGAGLTGEEEPLVGSEDGAEEAPAAGGPEAGGAEAL